jgi:hypothetical protein
MDWIGMRKSQADRKADLIDRLVKARQNLVQVAQSVPEEQRGKAFLGSWCIKDLLAHLIGWDYTNHQAIQEILSGKSPAFFLQYDKDWQSYNARLVKQYRIEPFDALLAEAAESHAQWIEYLRALSPEDVVNGKGRSPKGRTITIRNLLIAEARDESKHAEQVQAFVLGQDL